MEGGKFYMSQILYELFRNGKLFRSFTIKMAAVHYLAAAKELCPNDSWVLFLSSAVQEADHE